MPAQFRLANLIPAAFEAKFVANEDDAIKVTAHGLLLTGTAQMRDCVISRP